MATEDAPVGDKATVDRTEKFSENPFVTQAQKRMRAVKKKLEKIGRIEEKKAKNLAVDKDEIESLSNKPKCEILVEEYKKLVEDLLKIAAQEEKAQKEAEAERAAGLKAAQEAYAAERVLQLIGLMHVAAFFDPQMPTGRDARAFILADQDLQRSAGKNTALNTEADIDTIEYLSKYVCGYVAGPPTGRAGLDQAAAHASKFLEQSADVFADGLTYNHLFTQVNTVLESQVFQGVVASHHAAPLPPSQPVPEHVQPSCSLDVDAAAAESPLPSDLSPPYAPPYPPGQEGHDAAAVEYDDADAQRSGALSGEYATQEAEHGEPAAAQHGEGAGDAGPDYPTPQEPVAGDGSASPVEHDAAVEKEDVAQAAGSGEGAAQLPSAEVMQPGTPGAFAPRGRPDYRPRGGRGGRGGYGGRGRGGPVLPGGAGRGGQGRGGYRGGPPRGGYMGAPMPPMAGVPPMAPLVGMPPSAMPPPGMPPSAVPPQAQLPYPRADRGGYRGGERGRYRGRSRPDMIPPPPQQ